VNQTINVGNVARSVSRVVDCFRDILLESSTQVTESRAAGYGLSTEHAINLSGLGLRLRFRGDSGLARSTFEIRSETVVTNVLVKTFLNLGVAYRRAFIDSDHTSQIVINQNSLLQKPAQ